MSNGQVVLLPVAGVLIVLVRVCIPLIGADCEQGDQSFRIQLLHACVTPD